MIRNQVIKHLSGAIRSKKGESKGDVRRGATSRGVMEKSWRIKVIDRKEAKMMTQNEYFSQITIFLKYVLSLRENDDN